MSFNNLPLISAPLSEVLTRRIESQVSLLPIASQSSEQIIVVSTQVKSTELFDNVHSSFNHFLQSGQAWALLIGLFLGYFIRGLTR